MFRWVLIFLVCFIATANSAKILCYFANPSKSHVILALPIAEELSKRGHEVTVVVNNKFGYQGPNYREIVIKHKPFGEELQNFMFSGKAGGMSFGMLAKVITEFKEISLDTLKSPEVEDLLINESFDLVFFLNVFFNNYQLGIADHFKAPYVSLTPMGNIYPTRSLLGQYSYFSTAPSKITGFPAKMNFIQRLLNFGVGLMEIGISEYMDYQERVTYNELWPSHRYRSYAEMKKNISAMFYNGHWTDSQVLRPTLPNEIEVGGIQIWETPKPLEADVQKFLDEAQNGVIAWTFGSNVPISSVDPQKLDVIFKFLSTRKERVIMRWDSDDTSKIPSNFLAKKWLAQDSVLAHKNVKLFITHAGHGGMMEALYHKVPVFGIPFFGDQVKNIEKAVNDGWGMSEKIFDITEENFSKAITELLTNKKYKERVTELGDLYRDRLDTPLESAVFWIEYTLKYHGAPHLTYQGRNLNFFQLYSLDVIGFILVVLYVIWVVLKSIVKLIFRSLFGSKTQQVSKNKKKKKQ